MISLDTRHVDPVKAPLQLPLLLLQNHLLHLPGLGFKICQNRAAVGGAVPTKWQPYTTIKKVKQSSHLRVQLKICALSNQWDTRKCPCGVCWAFEPGLASPLSAASSLAICLQSTRAKEQRSKNPREHISPFVSLSSTGTPPHVMRNPEKVLHSCRVSAGTTWVGLKVLELRTNKPKLEWSTSVWNSLCRARYTTGGKQEMCHPAPHPANGVQWQRPIDLLWLCG